MGFYLVCEYSIKPKGKQKIASLKIERNDLNIDLGDPFEEIVEFGFRVALSYL